MDAGKVVGIGVGAEAGVSGALISGKAEVVQGENFRFWQVVKQPAGEGAFAAAAGSADADEKRGDGERGLTQKTVPYLLKAAFSLPAEMTGNVAGEHRARSGMVMRLRSGTGGEVQQKHLFKVGEFKRFAEIIVHAGLNAFFAVAFNGVGGEGNDGETAST